MGKYLVLAVYRKITHARVTFTLNSVRQEYWLPLEE